MITHLKGGDASSRFERETAVMPISMSFRLFGAIIGGVLVTELIYVAFDVMSKTVVLPIFVAVMFTLMHAVVQTYILTLLTSMFFGEAAEPLEKKQKKAKRVKKSAKIATSESAE